MSTTTTILSISFEAFQLISFLLRASHFCYERLIFVDLVRFNRSQWYGMALPVSWPRAWIQNRPFRFSLSLPWGSMACARRLALNFFEMALRARIEHSLSGYPILGSLYQPRTCVARHEKCGVVTTQSCDDRNNEGRFNISNMGVLESTMRANDHQKLSNYEN